MSSAHFSQSEDESEISELERSRLPKNLIDDFKKLQPLDKSQLKNKKPTATTATSAATSATASTRANVTTTDTENSHSSASESTIVVGRKLSSKKLLVATQSSPCQTPTSRSTSIDYGLSGTGIAGASVLGHHEKLESIRDLETGEGYDSSTKTASYSAPLLDSGTMQIQKNTETQLNSENNENNENNENSENNENNENSKKNSKTHKTHQNQPTQSSTTPNLPENQQNSTESSQNASNLINTTSSVQTHRNSEQIHPSTSFQLASQQLSSSTQQAPPPPLSASTQNLYTPKKSILICFVHPKSGGSGNQGKRVLRELKRLLTPAQVFDITAIHLPTVLKFCADNLPRYGWRIMVGGGDGSVAWVLTELDKLNLGDHQPPVAPLPLGTGNDLSRVLGWGGGYTGSPVAPILSAVYNSRTVMLDRWQVSTSDPNDKLPLTVINNYFTIGLDAEIANAFNEKRKENPDRFCSRTKNKVTYAKETMGKVFNKNKIYKAVKLVCDGVDYTEKLNEAKPKTILILNICSYAGGYDPWGTPRSRSKFTIQRPNDGKLEICVGDRRDMIMNLGAGKHVQRLCQASKVEITLLGTSPIAVQVDGEPWIQKANGHTLTVNFKNSVPMFLGKIKHHLFQKSSSLTEPWDLPKYQSSPANFNNNNNKHFEDDLLQKTTSAETWSEAKRHGKLFDTTGFGVDQMGDAGQKRKTQSSDVLK